MAPPIRSFKRTDFIWLVIIEIFLSHDNRINLLELLSTQFNGLTKAASHYMPYHPSQAIELCRQKFKQVYPIVMAEEDLNND